MKKILALVMTAAMLLCFASVVMAETAPAGQIAWYGFDSAEEAGLTAHGDNLTYADGTVKFGAASWLTADVDLADLTEITIAVKIKATYVTPQWVFEIGSQANHIGAEGGEAYLGSLLKNDGVIAFEAFSGGRINDGASNDAYATGVDATAWHEVVFTYANGVSTIYVDGVKACAENENGHVHTMPEGTTQTLAECIGSTPEFKLGRANWGDAGEFAVDMELDTVAVYNTALTESDLANALVKYEEPEAPQTGVATVALAVVAMLSGAYIVSKKH